MSEQQLAAYLEARDVLRRMQHVSARRPNPVMATPSASATTPPSGR